MSAAYKEERHQQAQQHITRTVQQYMYQNSLSTREAAVRFVMKPTTLHSRLNRQSDWTLSEALYMSDVMNVSLIQ